MRRPAYHDVSSRSYLAIALLLIGFFGGGILYRLFVFSASAKWQEQAAVVSFVSVEPKSSILHYRYEFEGRNYLGTRFRILREGSVPEGSEIRARFEKGKTISILVNPRKPSQSTVERGEIAFISLGTELLIVSIGLVLLIANRVQVRKQKVRTRRID
ncbi:DUF3592 domain-containing protein [Roseibacillus persicicus]|uniref:DUF3592 domain-containing protein n=1 Tax=Roseibacillus persicicus TaxID=454148 RepID=UPI00280F2FB8|nr:DUF3592 domain-containing protein [Roseibacillus persicicus]MDQ8188790.1 DUF3592 domain-containing protein [Roseibacillus persicicus]